MENIMDTLITDRTQADVDRARYLNSLWDPRALQWRGTPQERAEWEAGPRGAYGFSDMNRVSQAAAYLIGRLEELGYSVDIEDVTPAYNIRASVDPAGGGTASGGGVYYKGDTATLIAQAGEKYDFVGWMESGEIVSDSASYSFAVTGPRNLTASFALKKFQVIASADPQGSGEVAGGGTYDIDTEVTVAAAAGAGYAFTRWTEGDETVSDGPQYTFTLDRNRTLSAIMTKTYVVSVIANDTDGGTVSGGGIYLDGQTVTVAAVAGDGYEFAGWRENGTVVSTEETYTFQAKADRELEAVFVKTYVITLLVDPSGSGTASGGGTVLEGEQVTVTATGCESFRFVGWHENGTMVSPEASFSFTAASDRTLTAVFEEVPVYTITALIDPEGSGIVTGAGRYQEGAAVTLVATAGDGYKFSGWKENGQTVSTESSYTFSATTDRSLTALFDQKPSKLKWTQTILPVSEPWESIAYGNGRFISVGYYANKTVYSLDGEVWKQGGNLSNSGWDTGIAYGANKFVTINGGSKYHNSTNGETWSGGSISKNGLWRVIAYGGGKFVSLANSSSSVIYSSNGTSWASSSLPDSGIFTGICYGSGKFLAVAENRRKVFYSTNGSSWSTSDIDSGNSASTGWSSIAYGAGKFVAIASGSDIVAYSGDGINWEISNLPAADNWSSIAYGGGVFVAIASESKRCAYSADGVSWTEDTMPTVARWSCISFGGGKFVAVAGGGNVNYSSTVAAVTNMSES